MKYLIDTHTLIWFVENDSNIENMPIISCDTIFDSYPIVRIWQ